ncbi:MAG UNVERIFIED_CONTAM: hypothetical protein LOD86_11135, partial [Thermobifida fusca]
MALVRPPPGEPEFHDAVGLLATAAAALTAASLAPAPAAADPAPAELPDRVLAGYLHASFANGSGWVDLADVPDEWDIIHLAFAEPTSPTSGRLEFEPCPAEECPGAPSEQEFTA